MAYYGSLQWLFAIHNKDQEKINPINTVNVPHKDNGCKHFIGIRHFGAIFSASFDSP